MKPAAALAAALLLVLMAAGTARADAPDVELNGRAFYGEVYTDGGVVYVPLEVVGPLLVGSDFALDDYDVVLRRCSFHFKPASGGATVRATVAPCARRGATVYGPLPAFVAALGGSCARQGNSVTAAWPPVPMQTTRPPSPSPSSAAPPPSGPMPATMEIARGEVESVNRSALVGHAAIRRVEIYHPVSPDPAAVIPRTDLAGLKVYVSGLSSRDRVWISMWPRRDPEGAPTFTRLLEGFTGEDLAEGSFFVRLPMKVAAGWHVVRIDYNHVESVDYRFMTY